MAKTYFKAEFVNGQTVIRGSAADYGYTHAYRTYGGISFTAKPHGIPAKFAGEIVPVTKVEPALARRMLKNNSATASTP